MHTNGEDDPWEEDDPWQGNYDTTGEEGSRCVTRQQEVDDQHHQHGGVGELVVRVLGVEMIHRLFSSPIEQCGRLTEGAISEYFICSIITAYSLVLNIASVEL